MSPATRHSLQRILQDTDDAQVLRRAQALLWLAQGEPVKRVQQRLRIPPRTLYSWVERFQARQAQPVPLRLRDAPQLGRPPEKGRVVTTVIAEVMSCDPRTLGYLSPSWTAPLLRHYLAQTHELSVSERTIRYYLRDLGYRYKRPRHGLARRALTWRQAKGGSKPVSKGLNGR